ncbi:MAG: hypothetical protein E7J99_09420 [Clostridium butyricum]|uniref:hypothetical protein n=1 Tax=Clostridium sp. TaxID=1506 RepID=UPI00290009BD|nr:hypothetical protein [Clostridium sp.]MDU1116030.1 hypothetical protein [Clostridium sp.]MDU7712363.1 hypothetical protein [Clostridium butyricum]
MIDYVYKALDINKGLAGVINEMDILNFADGIYILNKHFGISKKMLSDYTGINYSTMRAICNTKEKVVSDRKVDDAIERLKIVYVGI